MKTADRDMNVAELIYQNSPHFYESIGFHCQQAVEKYLKAGLVTKGLPAPYTHDLARLLNSLNPFISFDLDEQTAAVALLEFAVELRYEIDEDPSYTSAELLAMAHRFQHKLRPLAAAFLT